MLDIPDVIGKIIVVATLCGFSWVNWVTKVRHYQRSMATTAVKISRRQRLDEEYISLPDAAGTLEPLCFYGPSLITVIFNAQTIVDATLFFIAGAHKTYTFDGTPDILSVQFVRPRIPSFFIHLLPVEEGGEEPVKRTRRPRIVAPKPVEEGKKRSAERARKRCAFFTVLISRRGRSASEPAIVHLAADVKLFHYTAHVCGLRDARDAKIVMHFIHQAFVANQGRLDSTDPDVMNEISGGDAMRRSFLDSNKKCCTVPLEVSEGDVVMTNICGRFPKTLNLRQTYISLSTNYPGVLTYLTTMSKSNYLAITLFEDAPFTPIRSRSEMGELVDEVMAARHSYLISSKKVRAKKPRTTFFIYASGRFIQSSRNNATALHNTERCMRLLHTIVADFEPPVIIEDEEGTATEADPDEDESCEDIEAPHIY